MLYLKSKTFKYALVLFALYGFGAHQVGAQVACISGITGDCTNGPSSTVTDVIIDMGSPPIPFTVINNGTFSVGMNPAAVIVNFYDPTVPTARVLQNNGLVNGGSWGAVLIGSDYFSISNNSNGSITNSSADAIVNLSGLPSATRTLTNDGVISGGNNGLWNEGMLSVLTNTNLISGGSGGSGINNSISRTWASGSLTGVLPAQILGITNSGTITSTGWYGIENYGSIGPIYNFNTISGAVSAIFNGQGSASDGTNTFTNNGYIQTILNAGVIQGATRYGIDSLNGSIDAIYNQGVISGALFGIRNDAGATINTLVNAQGGNSSTAATTALTYTGKLPTNYAIYITSPTYYGQLAVSNASGSTDFSIYTGSSVTNNTKYLGVISGVTSSSITSKTGIYGGYSWMLSLESGSNNVWDLIFGSLGPSAADTQVSLQNTAAAVRSTYALQNSVVANSLNYDCQVFDKNDVCVSAGGRNTNVQAGGVNNVSALLIAAYRAMPEVRLGAYLDQNLSVTAANSPVNMGNGGPLFGLFGVWNQNPDGTETEVKVSAAFGQKNATMTRAIVGTSEAGTGSSTLNNTGVQAIAKYGFAVTKDAMVSPYIGLRYTQGNMGSYVEATSATVTTPLTYAALNTNATTFMAGVHGKYKLTPEATVQASVGLESDTNVNNGSLTATGITGLTAINFNPNPVKTRPVAMLGAYYDVQKNQRVAVTGIYRQEPFQAVGSTTALATYTVGF